MLIDNIKKMTDSRSYEYYPPVMNAKTITGYSSLTTPNNTTLDYIPYSHRGVFSDDTFPLTIRPDSSVQFTSVVPIHPRRVALSGKDTWLRSGLGGDDGQFTGFPSAFRILGSNDGVNFDVLLDKSTIQDNRSTYNQKPPPIHPYFVYENQTDADNDTNPRLMDSGAFDYEITNDGTIGGDPIAEDKYYTTFRFEMSSDYANAGGVSIFRVNRFAIYGTQDELLPPYYDDIGEKQIVDLSCNLSLGDLKVGTGVDSQTGDKLLNVSVAPDQHSSPNQFGIAQAVTIKFDPNSPNGMPPNAVQTNSLGYIRISKTGTSLGTLIDGDTYQLRINFYPTDNLKGLRYTPNALTYRSVVLNDNFNYFEISKTNFGVVGSPNQLLDTYLRMTTAFNELNGFYNICNTAGVDYDVVPRPNPNFARTYGFDDSFNENALDARYPMSPFYPTDETNAVINNNLIFGGSSVTGDVIFPIKYSSFLIQNNQLVVTTDKTSTRDLTGIFFYKGDKLLVDTNLIPSPYQIIDQIVIVDGDTGRELVIPMLYVSNSFIIDRIFSLYNCDNLVTETNELATIPTDPILPTGMPNQLIYNKIVVSGNIPININELTIYENGLNNMTNSYIKSISDTTGRRYNSLIKDGLIRQYPVVWGTDTITEAQLPAIVADSNVDPNVITLTDTGIEYQKLGEGKFNFYSHADGANINNVQIGTIKGFSAKFTNSGASYAPFLAIYTKPKGDGSDMASWYNSKYVLTKSASDEQIESDVLYTIADNSLSVGSAISTTANFTDIINYVSIQSGSTDTQLWTINIREVNMVAEFVGNDLTIDYGFNHNLAITQNVVLNTAFNQVGMNITFYNNDLFVFETGSTSIEGNSYNMKMSLIEENEYPNPIEADVLMEIVLPFYSGWTKSPLDIDFESIVEDFLTSSSVVWGVIFTPEEKILNQVGIHLDKLQIFNYNLMEGDLVDALIAKAIEAGFETTAIMYLKQALGFGLTFIQAVEYAVDRIKPRSSKLVKLIAGIK